MPRFTSSHFLRLLQAIFAIICLSLNSSILSYYLNLPTSPTTPGFPPQFAYPILTSFLTLLLILPYFIISTNLFPRIANRYSIFIVETIACLLWTAAWIASAIYLCNLAVCTGSVCVTARVATGFAAVEALLFGVTAFLAGWFCVAGRRVGKEAKERKGSFEVVGCGFDGTANGDIETVKRPQVVIIRSRKDGWI